MKRGRPIKSFRDRFWSLVDKKNTLLCWNWRGYHRRTGSITLGRKKILSNRATWLITYGRIPKGLLVLHKCDNPICCNPHHLFLGTQKDNIQDAVKKGRWLSFRGSKNPFAKIDESKAVFIKNAHKKYSVKEISEFTKISQQIIYRVISFKTWRYA